MINNQQTQKIYIINKDSADSKLLQVIKNENDIIRDHNRGL